MENYLYQPIGTYLDKFPFRLFIKKSFLVTDIGFGQFVPCVKFVPGK